DMLIRRVAQILSADGSSIAYDHIFNHVTHNHSAAYYSTLAVGVWLFEDVYDQRLFEYQARAIAHAIEMAEGNLKPARMGATTIKHYLYKGNVVRQANADDGTPAGYPMEYNKHDLVVMRFDDLSDPAHPKPLAAWINWGEHPESLDGYNLHSGDYIAPLQRFVDSDIGAPMVFSQGDVGSSENTANPCQVLDPQGHLIEEAIAHDASGKPLYGGNGSPQCTPTPKQSDDVGVLRDWDHQGYVQTERNVRYLADDIKRAWDAIGAGNARVPYSSDFPVHSYLRWTPGPLSHPYPSVSNCRTDPTLNGDVGVPAAGLPDCERASDEGVPTQAVAPALEPLALVIETLKEHGLGVVPDNYDAPAFSVVEENLRLKLHTVSLGEVLLASCACEAQNDLILNLESRTDKPQHNIYDGFDWACLLPQYKDDAHYKAACDLQNGTYYDPALQQAPPPGTNFDAAAIAHMRAEVHNDAAGWDAPANALTAGSEPADISKIWGNFTKEELDAAHGYLLPVGVGHGGDYNGYTVSFREYQNRDSYRKALTSYGPHTADYMVTRLVRMAGAMRDGSTIPDEPDDVLAQADELRQQALATALGNLTGPAYDLFLKALPPDLGPAAAVTQPKNITHFDAATFSWTGGNNQVDNPLVTVERQNTDHSWSAVYRQNGFVQTMVTYPEGLSGAAMTYIGNTRWKWTASFEAYAAFPSTLESIAPGTYRFAVQGHIINTRGTIDDYALNSDPFTVSPWSGIVVKNAAVNGGDISFDADPILYPQTYTSPFPFIDGTDQDQRICKQCTFRPWAHVGHVASVQVTRAGGTVELVPASGSGGHYTAAAQLAAGDSRVIRVIDDHN
ncbi:MAG TPA: hypothetical protein VHE37_02800, partial [Nevskiaceae bacterium]|nr:hypothetical protein [Nevskiaceae bacterium]